MAKPDSQRRENVRKEACEEQLAELKQSQTLPLGLYTDANIKRFQGTMRDLFLNRDRFLTKRYLKLFIDRIGVELPKVGIIGRTQAILSVMQRKRL